MYLDLSARKAGILILVITLLAVAVSQTFALKDARFGTTPPLASLGYAAREASLRAWYGVEKIGWSISDAVRTAFGGQGGNERIARAIPVLTYHRIVDNPSDLNNVTLANFHDQMLSLKRAGWETISLAEYREFMAGEIELRERSFLITFDDGAKESFYTVDPLFEALGYEGVIYVIASAMHTAESAYYLSPNELGRMLKTGRWEIGSHSFDGHRPYSADADGTWAIFFADKLWLDEEKRLETEEEFTQRVRRDLMQARESLETEFGVPIDTFAFPLGNETGIQGAANFAAGASITEQESRSVYELGFLQTGRDRYSYNFPPGSFLHYRIHVDYDWDGNRLLQEIENGLPKDLPYEDNFSIDRGWNLSWGTLDIGRNNFVLSANEDASSASSFLDGTALWDNYAYNAAIEWQNGSVFMLADVQNSRTYNSCAFSDGVVRLQSTLNGNTRTLAEMHDPAITYGQRSVGIRVRGAVVECLWDFTSIIEAYERDAGGGIGVQVWNPQLGEASVRVSEIVVEPY